MPQNDNVELFKSILKDFNDNSILQDFILIGSWALRVYSEFFNNDPQIPIVATQDLDLLVTNPPKVSKEVNIPELLIKYDLEEKYSPQGDYAKFIGPNFEVEFLYPEKGRGEPTGKKVEGLKIVATPLRYMNFIQDYAVPMEYNGMSVRVPEPTVFVLMKYLLVTKRKAGDTSKIAKDISTAKDLEFFLLDNDYQQEFKDHFNDMPKKWQKELMEVLEKNDSELVEILYD